MQQSSIGFYNDTLLIISEFYTNFSAQIFWSNIVTPKTVLSAESRAYIHGINSCADWMRQHPIQKKLAEILLYMMKQEIGIKTLMSLRNQTDLETGRSQSGAVNLNKEDEDTRTRFGVTAMNEQRRGTNLSVHSPVAFRIW